MPRRPSKINRINKTKARPVNRSDSKLKKWDKASDIPMDEEDQFHTSRDKIFLEGGESGAEDDGDEEEVFGLQGLSDDSEDEEDPEDLEEDEDEEVLEEPVQKKKTKGKKANAKALESSSSGSEEEEETWGRNKSAYYSSNAAQLESDDEEANELEEQEAKRLQAKARDTMEENDFGLADPIELAAGQTENGDLLESASQPTHTFPQDKQELLRHLEKTNPESLALARDWDDTAWSLVKAQTKLKKMETETPDALSIGMSHLHYQAVLTYATTLAFYLHLRSSPKYVQNSELLKEHPIMSRLLALKQSISTLEDLDFAPSDDDEESGSDLGDGESPSSDEDEALDREQLWKFDKLKGLEDDELVALLAEAESLIPASSRRQPAEKPPKKKRKVDADSKKAAKPAFDLVEPVYARDKLSASSTAVNSGDTDAYGEATSLQHADQVDKAARKKSLRFHTSKIESNSARRKGARNAIGGDDDIPYRERKKEKEARLAKESEKKAKTKGQGGDDLDDVDAAVGTKKRPREDDEDDEPPADGADGYYELVKRKSKEKKEKKKADYEEAQAVARPNFVDDNATGPRSLTRAILSNKGLTPHRSKSVRNPRVKKRQKFDKAKKKISSQKAVYKGGIGDTGRYDGEKSGISKVVKSIRLG
ncbi:hypothetical protein HWV62_3725 [Athelia sp. TMB]|nr:hypothetical protein HWV62_3725 [Athelia sp. TMB]